MNRIALGDVAEKLAAKRIVGEKSDADYMEMLKYYPENDPDEFKSGWCAVFIYHCCREAGMNLPVGTNKTTKSGKFRWFTGVIAWVEWAQTCGFLHEVKDFSPYRGDIVIYNNIIPVEHKQEDSLWCDHIGIVLACNEDTITVAEGNVNNQNIGGIMSRQRNKTIGCYIRIPENNLYDNWQIGSCELSFREMSDTDEDKAQLLEWLSNPSVVEWAWKENAPWDMKKIEVHFVPKILPGSDTTPCFLELNGEAIGYIQYYPIAKDSYLFEPPLSYKQFEGGYGLDLMIGYPGLWNKGVGNKAVRMMADYLIASKGARLVCADPEENNPRSIACWSKAGFTPVGVIPNFDEPENRSVLMIYSEKYGRKK